MNSQPLPKVPTILINLESLFVVLLGSKKEILASL